MEALTGVVVSGGAAVIARVAASALVFLGFWLASAVTRGVVRRIAQRADPARQDAIRLLGRAASLSLTVFGAVTALGTAGVNVSALVAGLGLTGFALGFALRDALSNLLAGMLLLLYRPFRRRDHIAVAGFEGVVADIDLRYTTLEADGHKFLIPNAILFTNAIRLTERG